MLKRRKTLLLKKDRLKCSSINIPFSFYEFINTPRVQKEICKALYKRQPYTLVLDAALGQNKTKKIEKKLSEIFQENDIHILSIKTQKGDIISRLKEPTTQTMLLVALGTLFLFQLVGTHIKKKQAHFLSSHRRKQQQLHKQIISKHDAIIDTIAEKNNAIIKTLKKIETLPLVIQDLDLNHDQLLLKVIIHHDKLTGLIDILDTIKHEMMGKLHITKTQLSQSYLHLNIALRK